MAIFKDAKVGFDVFTTANKNLIFTSEANQPKVKQEGTLSFTATPQTQTVAHGLSYKPQILLFKKASGNSYFTFMATSNFVGTTNLSVTANNGDEVKYFILYNPLEDSYTGTAQTSTEHSGIRESKADNDVSTANIEELILTSDLAPIMIENTYNKTVEVTVADGTVYTETQAHGLPFTPAFITTVKFDIGGTDYNLPYEFISPPEAFYTYVDGTNITFSAEMRSYPAPLDVYFRTHVLNLELE